MLEVFFTVDVEIWCNGWKNIDAKFPQAFQQYIYGRTARGEYGLRYQLQQLRDHGLYGVFFVEPLFATRFGTEPLAEIIGLIKEYGQEVQLHMHPEWVDEALKPLLPKKRRKHPFMRDYSLKDQTTLIAAGIQLIADAGGGQVNAFRAGSFGFNENTLAALAANNIKFDSSYNASMMGLDSGIMSGDALYDTIEFDTLTLDTLTSVTPVSCYLNASPHTTGRIIEYPMTVFNDGSGSLRHAQLGDAIRTDRDLSDHLIFLAEDEFVRRFARRQGDPPDLARLQPGHPRRVRPQMLQGQIQERHKGRFDHPIGVFAIKTKGRDQNPPRALRPFQNQGIAAIGKKQRRAANRVDLTIPFQPHGKNIAQIG